MRIAALLILFATLAPAQTEPSHGSAPVNQDVSSSLMSAASANANVKRCRAILKEGRAAKNPDVRIQAVQAMSLVGPTTGNLNDLASMFADSDVDVRSAVVASLADFKNPGTIPILRKALEDPVAEVEFSAARALYQFRDQEAQKFLADVVSGETKGSSNFFSKQERSYLRLLHTPTKLVVTTAELAVPVPFFGVGVSSIQGILLDPGSSARAGALLLLGTGNDRILPMLVRQGLTDKDWSVRGAAAHVIATHPFDQLQSSLVPLLDDDKDAVRFRAAAAYLRLSESPAKTSKPPHAKRGKVTQPPGS
jgi:HEAT repeat protein